MDCDDFESVTLPDFTGDRVRAYAGLREIATQIKYFARAFPKPDEDRDYFSQCPASFNKSNLNRLRLRIHSEKGKWLCLSAKDFQANTVRKWNPTIDEATLSIFLGLVGIDEAASKECGAITLKLLLRAGVLVEAEDGSWTVTDDCLTRRVYLYGDAKTT